MNYRNIFAFLAISFGISGGAFYLTRLLELEDMVSFGLLILLSLIQLWGPGIAAIIVQKRMNKGTLKDLGYRSGRLDIKWFLGSLAGPLIAMIGTLAVIYVAGNVLGFESFGRVDLTAGAAVTNHFFEHWNFNSSISASFNAELTEAINLFVAFNDVGKWGSFLQFLLLATVLGATFILPFVIAAEMGFRGLLLKETQSLGFLGSGLVVGLVWGLWSTLPMMIIGYWDIPIMLTAIGSCIALSYVLSLISLKTGSIFASSAFMGILSLYTPLMGFFVVSGESHINGLGGVAGSIFFLFVTYLTLINGKRFVEQFPTLSYRVEKEEE